MRSGDLTTPNFPKKKVGRNTFEPLANLTNRYFGKGKEAAWNGQMEFNTFLLSVCRHSMTLSTCKSKKVVYDLRQHKNVSYRIRLNRKVSRYRVSCLFDLEFDLSAVTSPRALVRSAKNPPKGERGYLIHYSTAYF